MENVRSMYYNKLKLAGCTLMLTGLLLSGAVVADIPNTENPHEALKPVRLFTGDGERNFRIPSLTVTSKGTLLAFVCERMGKGDFGHDTDTVIRRSTDGGVTWTTPETILSEKGIDFHTGPVVVDHHTDSIFKFARSKGAKAKKTDWGDNYILRSDDDGVSWTKSVLKLENKRASFRFGPGNGGQGIQLADGTLVVQGGYNREYDGQKSMSLCLIESRDHGNSWQVTKGSDLDKAHVEFCMVETTPGQIYVNMREKYTPSRLYTSVNMGKSSITKAKPVTGLPAAQCRAAIVKVQEKAKTYLYFTGPTGAGKRHKERRVNLSLFRSNLEGIHWQKVTLIHRGVSGYSDLTVLPDGDLACLYEAGKAHWDEEILFLRIPKEAYMPSK